jgi:hypothetical protein
MLVLFGPIFLWVVSKIAGKSDLLAKLWAKESEFLPKDSAPVAKTATAPKA